MKTTKKKTKSLKTKKNNPKQDERMDIAVGHRPPDTLRPEDEVLFRAFQSNLLSLISHELRTPLMGILNSLSLLNLKNEEGTQDLGSVELPEEELLQMAYLNAQRLNRNLMALLDLAAIESGVFHARLRETDIGQLINVKFKEKSPFGGLLQQRKLQTDISGDGSIVLTDPQKFGRAVDLCIDSIVLRALEGSTIQLRITSSAVEFQFELAPGKESVWETAWSEALAGAETGVLSPTSAFSGVVQSEQAFLSRLEEGLGSELLLIHEIMRLHEGKFEATKKLNTVKLRLVFPKLSPENTLVMVVSSRTSRIVAEQGGLGTVVLAMIKVPHGEAIDVFRGRLKEKLFRATDAVYPLPKNSAVALVMDDCKVEDAPAVIQRLGDSLGTIMKYGVASGPHDSVEPKQIIQLAEERMNANFK